MTKAKVLVYSDSVLCLGKMTDSTCAIERNARQAEKFKMSASYKELTGIDGEPIELEWNSSHDLHRCTLFKRFRKNFATAEH